MTRDGVPSAATQPTLLANQPTLMERVQAFLLEADHRATKLVEKHRAGVEALATILLDRIVLDGKEARAVLSCDQTLGPESG